ncbi:MAG TPA: TIGR02594 family protein [Pseudolabrys sp.]|nr:TIGR02594 family protein [Pseudolabrys sp.]
MALIFCGAALMTVAGHAAAKPAHRHVRHPATNANVEAHVSPREIDYRGSVNDTVAAAVPAPTKTIRTKRRAVSLRAQAQAAPVTTGSSDLVSEARRYLGGNPTGRRSLWCGAFMDMVLKHTGHRGGGNLARAYAGYGTRLSGPQVGAIAVMARGGGGHVGVVSGIDASGNPIVISGNHNNTVAESVYPRGRIIAYVMPN